MEDEDLNINLARERDRLRRGALRGRLLGPRPR